MSLKKMTDFIKMRDHRIQGDNFLVQLRIKDYLEISKTLLKRNEFQRRRVRSAKSVYSLLMEDLIKGCVIPPISLAINSDSNEFESQLSHGIAVALNENSNNLLILDGLQRSYSIIEIEQTLIKEDDRETLEKFYNHKVRLEIYSGLNRLGILYRMLTLNTGQTPMSLRQQVEMLYLDYSEIDTSGIEIFRESDGRSAVQINQFNFKEIVEGFNSYIERNELPISRMDVLDNIKSLEKLSDENSSSDIFKDYLESMHSFIVSMDELTQNTSLPEDIDASFGNNSTAIFKRSQSFTGFGAAIGKMKDRGLIQDFNEVKELIQELEMDSEDIEDFLEKLNEKFSWIKKNASKIGNAQRNYFQFFYRELFNKESSSYMNLLESVDSAFDIYYSQYH